MRFQKTIVALSFLFTILHNEYKVFVTVTVDEVQGQGDPGERHYPSLIPLLNEYKERELGVAGQLKNNFYVH